MARRRSAVKRPMDPDPKYKSTLVTEFVKYVMRKGKKAKAEKICYTCIEKLAEMSKQDPVTAFKKAINNVKPVLEVKSRRVGGATYQVPMEVSPNRRTALALRWIISYARARRERTMADKLAAELFQANNNEGSSIKKKEDTHRMAEANKAFAHFRW